MPEGRDGRCGCRGEDECEAAASDDAEGGGGNNGEL